MIKTTQTITLFLVALVAGFAGGALSVRVLTRSKTGKQAVDVIQAQRFQAVGNDGRIRAEFGVENGETPFVKMFGLDGGERFWMILDNVDEPIMMMKDVKGNIRTYWGHETSNTASLSDDDWVLGFSALNNEDAMAQVGVLKRSLPGKHNGFVAVRDEQGRSASLFPH